MCSIPLLTPIDHQHSEVCSFTWFFWKLPLSVLWSLLGIDNVILLFRKWTHVHYRRYYLFRHSRLKANINSWDPFGIDISKLYNFSDLSHDVSGNRSWCESSLSTHLILWFQPLMVWNKTIKIFRLIMTKLRIWKNKLLWNSTTQLCRMYNFWHRSAEVEVASTCFSEDKH